MRFGPIASAAGPAYVVELAHPAYRGFMAVISIVTFIPPKLNS